MLILEIVPNTEARTLALHALANALDEQRHPLIQATMVQSVGWYPLGMLTWTAPSMPVLDV